MAGGGDAQLLYTQQRSLLFLIGVFLFWLAAAFHYLLIAFEASRVAETRALELNLLAREAELKALRAQIDPHFIFNSLHSISALTTTNPRGDGDGLRSRFPQRYPPLDEQQHFARR